MPKNRIHSTDRLPRWLEREMKEATEEVAKHPERRWAEIEPPWEDEDGFYSIEHPELPELSAGEKKVLKFFAQNGQSTKYDISKEDTDFARGTAGSATETLKQKGLLQLVRKEPHKPKDKVYYDITFCGLVLFLSDRKNWTSFEAISDVAHSHPKLIPLIFGNWDYFVQEGVRDDVIKKLKELFSDENWAKGAYFYASEGSVYPKISKYEEDAMARTDYVPGCAIANYIIFHRLDPYWRNISPIEDTEKPLMNAEIEKWVQILVRKEELRNYITAQLEVYRRDFNERLSNIKLWENLIEKAKKRQSQKLKNFVDRKPIDRKTERWYYQLHRQYRRMLGDVDATIL